MPWSGAGTYSLPPAYSPEVNGTTIDAARYNGLTGDVATGISAALAKNGENVPTANLPMGGFRHTGVASAVATGQYLAYGQTSALLDSLTVTNGVTAASFSGPLTGNATTATTLATPRAINGVNFDGSAPITVTAAAGTLTGATLAAGVTASSLTSFGASIALGTPASGNLANCTFPTLNQNTTGSAGSVAAANITGTTLPAGITASSLTSFGIVITSGTYTPTASSQSNCSTGTVQLTRWLRVGSVVHVTGAVNFGVTGAGVWSFILDLPVEPNFTETYQLGGFITPTAATGFARIIAAGSSWAIVSGNAASGVASGEYPFTFTYQIVS